MGDDYDILCRDIFEHVEEILDSEAKAAKKLAALRKCHASWKTREESFKAYRELRPQGVE